MGDGALSGRVAAPPEQAAGPRRPGPLGATLSMIAFPHTLFALPFAFMGAILAARGAPGVRSIVFILTAMVGARSAAMVFNRIADRRYDRRNPRTADRPLVTGALGLRFARGFLAASCALFVLSAGMLNRLALALSLPALAIVLSYSYAKRFTCLTHLHLGASLGLAPVGAWIAVRGDLAVPPLVLAAAVALWVAGFDVLYACQDVAFDRSEGLHSIPCRFGVPRALRVSSALHAGMVALLLLLPRFVPLGSFYRGGVLLTAALLFYEHRLVRPDDLRRLNRAFFTLNGWIAFLILATTTVDVALRR